MSEPIEPTTEAALEPVALRRSIAVGIALFCGAALILVMALWAAFAVSQFKDLSMFQVKHEARLVADSLKASVEPLLEGEPDVEGMQSHIDRLVANRDTNDVEINVVLVRGSRSDVVASSISDNIDRTSSKEHYDVVRALERDEPIVWIARNEDRRAVSSAPPSESDYRVGPGDRFVQVTFPLIIDGEGVGCASVRMSLAVLDRKIAAAYKFVLLAALAAFVFLTLAIMFVLRTFLLNPLRMIARHLSLFGQGELEQPHISYKRSDEVGVLAREFNVMVAQLTEAEAMKEEVLKVRAEKEKRDLEHQLRQAQKMEALGTLAGGIAHDFNNILTPILGYADITLLRLREDETDFTRESLLKILEASKRAKDLVAQILAFSRQSEARATPIQIAPIVKEVLKLIRASLPATIEIVSDIPEESPTVLADPTQIHQVVMNLCTNAFHAMEARGGTLTVTVSNETVERGDLIDKHGLLPGPYLRLSVQDTGHGMTQQTQERIFEPYFTTKEEGKGTGLGLSIVHGILTQFKGGITVSSELGKGTRFDIYLLPVDEDSTESESTLDELIPRGTERVLVVDDEEQNVEMLAEMLRGLGYVPTCYSKSEEALERFAAAPDDFDLVITDMTMPRMTGLQLAGRVMNIRPEFPLILITGYNTLNERQAQAVGIRACVMKPIVTRQIAGTIRKVLDRAA